jgi:hypothetical protein
VGGSVTLDRKANEMNEAKATKLELNLSHNFDDAISLGASVDYSNAANSDSATTNLEATAGHRLRIDGAFSVVASVGLGERLQVAGSGDDFPYYVFRMALDVKLGDKVTWNAASFRYRDAFDPSDDYLTPQVGTGVTFRTSHRGSISGKVNYNLKDWDPDSIGFSLGYKHEF